MGPVTENPFLVAIINMVVVFGVLIVLGVLMHVIEMIDPTKKKVTSKAAAPAAAVAAPAVPKMLRCCALPTKLLPGRLMPVQKLFRLANPETLRLTLFSHGL